MFFPGDLISTHEWKNIYGIPSDKSFYTMPICGNFYPSDIGIVLATRIIFDGVHSEWIAVLVGQQIGFINAQHLRWPIRARV